MVGGLSLISAVHLVEDSQETPGHRHSPCPHALHTHLAIARAGFVRACKHGFCEEMRATAASYPADSNSQLAFLAACSEFPERCMGEAGVVHLQLSAVIYSQHFDRLWNRAVMSMCFKKALL